MRTCSIGESSPSSSKFLQRGKIASGAPLLMIRSFSSGGADDYRHDPSLKVERDLVDLGVIGDVRLVVRCF